ncbi:hypothetical protein P343_10935 [Sporolactobacillus laevolacticus DSM 442]|uniref:Uncharacterized protein n=1 Tax=Sporolactobacillus laevolacticus DSM 442 TaxID=1395513 RepID=V6IYI5_9BACL|nr:hypothetical protein P343_10935 [Sporolactobacillus laevolacticus DSM 442]
MAIPTNSHSHPFAPVRIGIQVGRAEKIVFTREQKGIATLWFQRREEKK